MPTQILKRASAPRQSGEWGEDDFDVLVDGLVVGRIMKVHPAPEELAVNSRQCPLSTARFQ